MDNNFLSVFGRFLEQFQQTFEFVASGAFKQYGIVFQWISFGNRRIAVWYQTTSYFQELQCL